MVQFHVLYPLLALAVINGTAVSLFYKRAKGKPIVIAFCGEFWGLVIFWTAFLISFAFVDNVFSGITWSAVGWITLKAFSGLLCGVTWLWAVKCIPASIADPLAEGHMFVYLVIGWVFFGEAVGIWGVALMAVIFIACLIIGIMQFRHEQRTSTDIRGFVVSLGFFCLWLVLSSISMTIVKFIAMSDIVITTWRVIELSVSFAFATILMLCNRESLGQIRRAFTDKTLIGMGICDNIWVFFYVPLARVMNQGVLEAILVASVALTVVGGVVLLKERIRWYIYPLIVVILFCSVTLALMGF